MEAQLPLVRPCPYCRQSVAADAAICPDCGGGLPAVWPPPGGPSVLPPGLSDPPPSRWQVTLGVVLGILFVPAFAFLFYLLLYELPFVQDQDSPAAGAGIAAAILGLGLGLYFGTRRWFPAFARAFGGAFLGAYGAVLGLLALYYAIVLSFFR